MVVAEVHCLWETRIPYGSVGLDLRVSQRIPELPRVCHRCVQIHCQATRARQPRMDSPPPWSTTVFFQALPSQLRLSKSPRSTAQVNPNVFFPARLVQTGANVFNARAVPMVYPLAVPSLVTPRAADAGGHLGCLEPGSVGTVSSLARDSIIIKRWVSDGSGLAKPPHISAGLGLYRAVSNTNSTLHNKKRPPRCTTRLLGTGSLARGGTRYLGTFMSEWYVDRQGLTSAMYRQLQGQPPLRAPEISRDSRDSTEPSGTRAMCCELLCMMLTYTWIRDWHRSAQGWPGLGRAEPAGRAISPA